ncbi:hypothetical protein MmiHf6_04630 [Methanimicrococcus hongohii]|uniref:DUF4325 domain-containing protein n=1 Tax=Methanimicrococcus hongohii TaxID=3028295 RepID=A0AA96UYW7_9EURY|nr:hypothetical protein [Methanimicrococcus sp. Hf6]WNY23159.1 hypothetical protein MmiHf6_04630 [Methanimicrococcus sp. Hf6]
MIIKATNHFKTGYSVEDSDILSNLIDSALANGEEKIIIDFTGIVDYCPAFFRFALTHRLEDMTREKYDERFRLIGLSELGKGAYKLTYDNMVSHYSLSPKARRELEKKLEELVQEYLY